MKTALLICTALSAGFTSLAQPVIESTDFYPVAGESLTNHYFSGTLPSAGSAGANQIWDLSTLETSYTEAVSYASPGSNYPAATISCEVSNPTADGVFYFEQGTSGRYIHGFELFLNGELARTFYYDNSLQTMMFPIQMGASYADDYSCTIFTETEVYQRVGTRTVEVDGYGTLITPQGTFTDVIRMHFVSNDTDIHDGSPTDSYSAEGYYWYKAGFHDELAILSSNSTNGVPVSTTSVYLEVDDLGVPSGDDVTILAWPNPATDKVKLIADLNDVETISATDMSGRSVNLDFNELSGEVELSVDQLQSGAYVLSIQYASGQTARAKLVVD